MATYGIVIEGSYDEAALKELIKKCLPSEIKIISRSTGGKIQLMKKFQEHLDLLQHARRVWHVDKALVIRDADGNDPEELLQRMREKIQSRTYPFELKLIIIVQELETWLLADEEAISRVTQTRSGRTVSRINEDLESIVNPKEKLKTLLSGAKVPYTQEVAREIAEQTDLPKIEYRCPSFRIFRQAVLDC